MEIYEERRVVLRNNQFKDYKDHIFSGIWPSLEAAGARPLCLLNGLIGAPSEECYLFTGFKDADAWLKAQELITGVSGNGGSDLSLRSRAEIISEERVRLLLPSPMRPNPETRAEDRRAVYGFRRWWINPEDYPEFARLSLENIWPAMDEMGHHVLGQFREAATTDPMEVINLAGYDSPAHWHETRSARSPSSPISDEARRLMIEGGPKRRALEKRTYVTLMTAHWPD